MNERKRICVLGNCVAYRLQMMLAAHAELTERYALVYMPTVYEIARLPDRGYRTGTSGAARTFL